MRPVSHAVSPTYSVVQARQAMARKRQIPISISSGGGWVGGDIEMTEREETARFARVSLWLTGRLTLPTTATTCSATATTAYSGRG